MISEILRLSRGMLTASFDKQPLITHFPIC